LQEKISVGLVVYKSTPEQLEPLSRALLLDSHIGRVVVFDNNEKSSLRAWVELQGWEYLTASRNLGFGSAHNRIIDHLALQDDDLHLIVNPDISWCDSPISGLIDFLDKSPSVAAVMPDVRYPDGRRQYLAKRKPSASVLFGRRFLPSSIAMRKKLAAYELRDWDFSSPKIVPIISGCFMLVRGKALHQVGGFDSRYFLYMEDYDLCLRLKTAGWEVAIDPCVQVLHRHERASYHWNITLYLHLKSAFLFFCRWGWW